MVKTGEFQFLALKVTDGRSECWDSELSLDILTLGLICGESP